MSIRVRPGRLPRLARRAEAAVGLASAALVVPGLIAGGISHQFGNGHGGDPYQSWEFGGWFAVMVFGSIYVRFLGDAMRDPRMDPLAPRFALRWGRMPAALRPIVALWWAAHSVVVTGFTFFVEAAVGDEDARFHTFGPYGLAVQFGLFLVIGFTIAFASNLYAVLAVASAGGGERAVAVVWRWRLAIDLAVAVTAAVAAAFARTYAW